ncbi:MAG: glycosyltransferase [Candidatus Latescibacteria bacterium]|nr:glycosyltransferase [Candidatus Latescibacterota bacterium]
MSNQERRVSVIIPTYNRASYLVESLESVLAQTYRNLEVIVVNDGSTDETKVILEAYQDRISYFEKTNGGKSSALNFGLKHISGEYVWVFDDDDVALPELVASHISVFESQPEVGFVYSGYAFFEGKDADNVIETVEATAHPDGEMLGQLLSGNFISGVSVVVRRQCYDRVGIYDERLIRAQDYDMWIRLARAGYKAGVIQKPLVRVRKHDGLRGSEEDRFKISILREKHLEYHRIIMKKIYWEVPLDAISPELSIAPDDPERTLRALLKRTWIVANTMLVEETTRDLSLVRDHLSIHGELRLDDRQRVFLSALKDYAGNQRQSEIASLSELIVQSA